MTACPDSYFESVQDTAERVKPELSEVITSVVTATGAVPTQAGKGRLVHHIQLSSSKEMHPGNKGMPPS